MRGERERFEFNLHDYDSQLTKYSTLWIPIKRIDVTKQMSKRKSKTRLINYLDLELYCWVIKITHIYISL